MGAGIFSFYRSENDYTIPITITIVLHLPPGHLPPPFLWHLPPLFLWYLPPPTFVHLPPGQLPPLKFFLIFHLFKRFKMTNFSLEVVMDEVLDM